jgi:Tannase and feruloyl esterase
MWRSEMDIVDKDSLRKLRVLFATALTSFVSQTGASAAPVMCADLTGLSLPDTKITLARSYDPGETVSGVTKAPVGLCRVAGTVKPSTDSNIKFEVWIPADGSWNGRFEQIGNGGFAGTVWVSYIADAVSRGYAAAATDDGTAGPPPGAATFLGHPDVQEDYGYRAIKVTTDNSRAIIKALTGQYPRYSYFSGCSDGGREALVEAQRYPTDFDGVIVGSPSNDLVGLLGASFLWNMQALLSGPKTRGIPDAYIPPSKLNILSKLAISQCVGRDGGIPTDPFLNDPTECNFDVAAAQCKADQDSDTCLTAAQVKAARKIYWGPHNLKGELIFPGLEPGSESNATDWPEWLVGTSPVFLGGQDLLTKDFWCDEVLQEPNCRFLHIQENLEKMAASVASVVNATNPDLSQFRNHGGKLIQYAGWADAAIAPQSGLDYYAKVTRVMGDVHDFYRVFMAPGMAHCYGGAGPNSFGNGTSIGPVVDAEHDLLKALERWVEQGIAPDQIIATKYFKDDPAKGVAFQRPLCPYPLIARYSGYGNTSEPSSFECSAAQSHRDAKNTGLQENPD